jgi:hypothetical protein
MSTIETPPPPGSNGLPLLGETLTFAKNPFRFIEERSLPPQNYEMDFSKTPPEPKDALRATVRAK